MIDHPVTRAVDALSLGAIVVALLDYAPKIAGLVALVWWLTRLYYEIRTGERKLRRKP